MISQNEHLFSERTEKLALLNILFACFLLQQLGGFMEYEDEKNCRVS